MKEGKPSRTAEAAAFWRAAESLNPEGERVCYDPFASHFVRPAYAIVLKCRLLRRIGLWYAEQIAPGAQGEVVARTRYIDDYLKMCIEDGIEQLVVLGAGYDSRAYRFHELEGRVKVFEVDIPTTQGVKTDRVKKIFGSLPENVVYVPVDFENEKLDQRLFESGYDGSLKTVFTMEGVAIYLTAEAVDEILSFVARNSGTGSSIIFNYIYQSVVEGTCKLAGANAWRKSLERIGEPPMFGIEANAVERFLSERGFYQVKNVSMDCLRRTYFKGKNRDRKLSCWVGLVHAKVKPQ